MADGHIVLQDVRKSFGPKHVLNGVNLEVPKGIRLSSSAAPARENL